MPDIETPTYNNTIGDISLDLHVEPFGTAKTVAITCSAPVPVIEVNKAAEGWTLVSCDEYPRMALGFGEDEAQGSNRVDIWREPGHIGDETVYRYPDEGPVTATNAYFGYNCFTEPILAQADYGTSLGCGCLVKVVFDSIVVADPEGNEYEFASPPEGVQTSKVVYFEQHAETGGWGSETQTNLFIPWENLR